MSRHQHDDNAEELWSYFEKVIRWVRIIFPKYRKEMAGVEWGPLYNRFKNEKYDVEKLEADVSKLMQDDDIKKAGIYPYILNGDEKHLSIRAFTPSMIRGAFERQKGVCPFCKAEKREKIQWEFDEMEADHITPWHLGGKTDVNNCQMLCVAHNRKKSGK